MIFRIGGGNFADLCCDGNSGVIGDDGVGSCGDGGFIYCGCDGDGGFDGDCVVGNIGGVGIALTTTGIVALKIQSNYAVAVRAANYPGFSLTFWELTL